MINFSHRAITFMYNTGNSHLKRHDVKLGISYLELLTTIYQPVVKSASLIKQWYQSVCSISWWAFLLRVIATVVYLLI